MVPVAVHRRLLSLSRLVLVLLLGLLVAVLLVHLIGMIHSEGMSGGGGCLFLLVASLLVLAQELVRRPPGSAAALRTDSWHPPVQQVCRPPPRDGWLAGAVLIC